MRNVESPASITNFGGREVKGVSAISALKPLNAHEVHILAVASADVHQVGSEPVPQMHHRSPELPDRRKVCRRMHKQAVLLDMRTGVDRRHGHGRETDPVEHIDIKV
ncbi:MAG: hypothetical protein PHY62_03535 [Gallionella sp.]|nr:hypothetical protein [Gallionella sp.]